MDYCLLELPTPFLSDLQARCGIFWALLRNHFAGTWTMANFVQASLKLAFQEQLCPDRHAMQTCAAGVPAVSFDDSTVDNKSRLALAVTIVSILVLGEGCNLCKKACCSNCTVGNQWKSCKKGLAMNGLSIHMLHTVHTRNSPPPGSAKIRTGSIADLGYYTAFFHGGQWTTASWNCRHPSFQICKRASEYSGPCY